MKTAYVWGPTAQDAMYVYNHEKLLSPAKSTFEFRQIVQEAPNRFVVIYDYDDSDCALSWTPTFTPEELAEIDREREEKRRREEERDARVLKTSFDELFAEYEAAKADPSIMAEDVDGIEFEKFKVCRWDIERKYELEKQIRSEHNDTRDARFALIMHLTCLIPLIYMIAGAISCGGNILIATVLGLILAGVQFVICWIILMIVFSISEPIDKRRESKHAEVLKKL